MSGLDGFGWLCGLGALAIAVSVAFSIPELIRVLERIATADKPRRAPPPSGDPWGPRT